MSLSYRMVLALIIPNPAVDDAQRGLGWGIVTEERIGERGGMRVGRVWNRRRRVGEVEFWRRCSLPRPRRDLGVDVCARGEIGRGRCGGGKEARQHLVPEGERAIRGL